MSLKKFIKKSIASTMALSLLFGNCSLCGVGISQVIAENAAVPEVAFEIVNEKYVHYKKEIETEDIGEEGEGEETTEAKEIAGVAIESNLAIYSNQNQDTYMPTESVEIGINLPRINDTLPAKVLVAEAHTKSTTGEELNKNINQNYDSDSGLLTITYENLPNQEGNIYSEFVAGARDEFKIIYTYSEQAYMENNEEEIKLEYDINAKMTFKAESESLTSETADKIELTEKENRGDIVTFALTEQKDKIYKGFMYSNIENKTNYDTEYNTVSTFAILNTDLLDDTVEISLLENKFVLNDDATEVGTNGNVLYKSTKISKYEFNKMIGQGYIEIYNGDTIIATVKYLDINEENKLCIISADGQVAMLEDTDDMINITYPANISDVKIKMSKPLTEGYIHFENKNVIKGAQDYGCKVEDIKYITTETKVDETTRCTEMELLEPRTKIEVTSSNVNFSTLQTNKTTLTVKLDDTNSSVKLFDNPVITITLPKGLTAGNLSSPTIVNGNGLKIKNTKKVDDNVITIELEGKQTSYDLTNITGGATIVMDIENLKYSDTIPTRTDKILVTCLQNQETTSAECNVNIVSKAGLLVMTKLSNYNEENKTTTILGENNKTVEISEIEGKEVVNSLNLVNNYDVDLTNVQIIGRIDYSDENLKTTFATNLTKPIEVNDKNVKVYYSTNPNASYDDENWNQQYSQDAKAIKIVLNNNQIAKASFKEVKTHINVPANLGYNQENYIKWEVAYTYNGANINSATTVGMLTEKNDLVSNETKTKEEIVTPEGEKIPVTIAITPYITENYVHSGQLVTYKIQLINNGEEDLENLVLKNIIPENAIYTYREEKVGSAANYTELVKDANTKEKRWDIKELKAGETKEYEVMQTMANVTKNQEIVNKAVLEHNNQIATVTNTLTLKPSKIEVSLTTREEEWVNLVYRENNIIEYYIKVKNISGEKLENIKVQQAIPEFLTYQEGGLGVYDEFEGYSIKEQGEIKDNVFEYNIKKLKANKEEVVVVRYKVQRLVNKYTADINSVSKISIEDGIYQTNVKTIKTVQAAFMASMETNVNETDILKSQDSITYTITVTNIGETNGTFTLRDTIPNQIEVNKIECAVGDNFESIESSVQDVEISLNLEKAEKAVIRITGKVRYAEENEETITIGNVARVIYGENEIETNEVKATVKLELLEVSEDENEDPFVPSLEPEEPGESEKPDQPKNPEDETVDIEPVQPDDIEDSTGQEETETDKKDEEQEQQPDNNENQEQQPDNNEEPEETYSISGYAWLDQNKDGKMDENEKVQENIKVILVNKDIGNFALDKEGNRIITTTDNLGKYTFNNIVKGNYLVLFEFDTNQYTVTTYRKTGVEDTKNSDVILSTATIDGVQKLVAVTDGIELNSNKEDINIGLMENAIFDLSLNKQITEITVKNSKGTETYKYDEGDTAKVDLVAKYMNGAKVTIKYKFTIKNEGEVTGYVESLLDEIPDGLDFDKDLNKDWTKGNDGKLYYTALSGTGIEAGESREVELILTKTMTEDNTGVFPNSAKLEKISNLENIEEKEEAIDNNQSSAMLIISIKTGTIFMYIGITLLCASIILTGTYFIKKKVLNVGI